MEKVHRFELNISSNSISIDDDVEKYQRLLSDFANRVQVRILSSVKDRFDFDVFFSLFFSSGNDA